MRAIILAAGMGTRLRPLTDDTPKGLVKVKGLPMVEKEIRYLKEIGIDDIIVVTGYLKEKFNYLVDKYGVKLIHNDKYDIYNNLYTMYLVREYLEDTYVLESDIYMRKNVLDSNISKTTYFGAKEYNFENEWIFKADKDNRIKEMYVGSSEEDIILRGISYWTKEDGKYIAEKIEETVNNSGFDNLYWDEVVIANIADINIQLKVLNEHEVMEIDSIEDFKKVEEILSQYSI
ncbi:MAG: NTP transferase domain-containing protein [Clostridium sp.]|uniref:sugar phosphate nucleotidyltransferase n=1 Tax=Clostridium sp. TaxID=1506 RepID=UPI00290B758C|nr:sugar phosphate nucleotidyltransferase [Clostridium sp.]MDU5109855.1 NTP transferase domain-containing protein [Clostridium sp.]